MKKLATITALLLVTSTSALATQNYSISTSLYTNNPFVHEHIFKNSIGYNVGASADLTPNVYISGTLTRYRHSKIGYSVTGGIKEDSEYIQPFLSMTNESVLNENNKMINQMGYTAGMKLVIVPAFNYYFEISNFYSRERISTEVGVNVPVGKYLAAQVGYEWKLNNHADSLKVKISYLF